MSIFGWFGGGTPTEQKRDQYKRLYNKLLSLSQDFDRKEKQLSQRVDTYLSNRANMEASYIPEDVFSNSESTARSKVVLLKSHQSSDGAKLAEAVSAAYSRYQYYHRLAIQEAEERRREAERRRRKAEEAAKKNRG
ncbi:TPA: hypothetical protein U1C28_001726 [Streptococcus suis]|nr:hypothetical protein [Streptococcus suis]HEM3608591.1 hypothetical protein [Streptococcus suis]HEM3647036.1 hypothetical protein [Streptococcus suis]HEM3711754.1 hypothetical protein [Streptococcus suis]